MGLITPAWTDNSIITRWPHTHQWWMCVTPPSDNTSVITRAHAAYAFLCDSNLYLYRRVCVCLLYRRVCVCLCVYPSKHIYVAVCGPIGTKFGTHMQIHLEKVVGKIKNCPVWHRGHMGGFRGRKLTNGGNLPIGWTDWHQIWHTYADSSGNGCRLKK